MLPFLSIRDDARRLRRYFGGTYFIVAPSQGEDSPLRSPQKAGYKQSGSLVRWNLRKNSWDSAKFSLHCAFVSVIVDVYVLDGCPPSAPTDGFRAVVSFVFGIVAPFHSIVCLRSENLYFHLPSGMQKVVG